MTGYWLIILILLYLGYLCYKPKFEIIKSYGGRSKLVLWYNCDTGDLFVQGRDFIVMHEW